MYEFSSKTKVAQKFKLSELLKMIHADKELKQEANSIESVQMTNAISQATTGLVPSEEVNEIYIIEILLKNEVVPHNFIKALDKTIRFQVLYKIVSGGKVKWMSGPKAITDDKLSQTRHFETEWMAEETKELPLVSSLTELYKEILVQLTNLQFRPGEKIKQWEQRLTEIEHLKKDFEKTEKLMNAETQPKKKFAYNEKLREVYQKMKELKE